MRPGSPRQRPKRKEPSGWKRAGAGFRLQRYVGASGSKSAGQRVVSPYGVVPVVNVLESFGLTLLLVGLRGKGLLVFAAKVNRPTGAGCALLVLKAFEQCYIREILRSSGCALVCDEVWK